MARVEACAWGGSGEGRPFSGRVAGPDGSAPEAFQAILFEDVLLVAREGRDVEPLFLALAEAVDFDEASLRGAGARMAGARVGLLEAGREDGRVPCPSTSESLPVGGGVGGRVGGVGPDASRGSAGAL